jgi:hypothetical protein
MWFTTDVTTNKRRPQQQQPMAVVLPLETASAVEVTTRLVTSEEL